MSVSCLFHSKALLLTKMNQMRVKKIIIAFLLLVSCLSVSAQGIDLKLKDVTVEKAIAALNRTGNYSIVLNSDAFDLSKVISVNAQNASIDDVLSQIFAGQNATFKVNGKKVMVSKAETPATKNAEAASFKGNIKDSKGEPVIGAVISVKGGNQITTSDLDGNFEIVAPKGAPLLVSCMGYSPAEVSASHNMQITLADDIKYLDEVVVIGYGTQRKKDLTGAISHIDATEMQLEAPMSVNDIIRGGVAGVSTGLATDVSGDVEIQVRGKNTITAGSSPLLVLDGVVYNGSMTDLNPADIESIDVLKDASSAAIYGAKAASGVIMITTKKGTQGEKPVINFNVNIGMAQAARVSKLLDGQGFIDFRREYFYGLLSPGEKAAKVGIYDDPRTLQGVDKLTWYNYTQSSPVSVVPDDSKLVEAWLSRIGLREPEILHYMQGIETDWDAILYPNALQQDYNVSVSNRNEKSSYYASIGLIDRDGTVAGTGYHSVKGRINFDTYITKWLSTGVNAMFTARDASDVGANMNYREGLTPYCTNDIDDLDSPYRLYPTTNAGTLNPFLDQYYIDRRDMNYNLNLNLYAKIKLPFGFEFQSNFSPRLQWREYYSHNSSEHPQWGAGGAKAIRDHENWYNWQVDNVLRWNQTFGDHHIEMTFLQNAEKNQYWKSNSQVTNFSPSDVLGYHFMDAGQSAVVKSEDTYSTANALMARLFYQFKGRYMLTASVRRDGYSAFGVNNPYGVFPSAALGWVFSEEKFASSINWLNYGKLRLSYGVNGNRDIGIYSALSQLNTNVYEHINPSGTQYVTNMIYISKLGNATLKWERTKSFNVGLDYALFNNFVDGSLDFYSNKTSDLLISRSLPTVIGYDSIISNLGLLGNKGFEFSANFHLFRNTNFKWDSTVNISANRRKVISLYGEMEDVLDENGNVIGQKEADDKTNWWFIGHDTNEIIDYEDAGVWQLGEEEEAIKYGCKPGDFKFVDQNNDGVLNNDDKIFTGRTTTPKWNVSWRNSFSIYKNFSFSFMMYAKLGQWGAFNRAAFNNGNGLDRSNIYDLPRWTENNPTNDFARINSLLLTNHWVNRSFVRMDNVSFTYSVPSSFLKKLSIQGASISLNMRNPFVLTKWACGDPENLDNPDYSLKSYTLGLNITL